MKKILDSVLGQIALGLLGTLIIECAILLSAFQDNLNMLRQIRDIRQSTCDAKAVGSAYVEGWIDGNNRGYYVSFMDTVYKTNKYQFAEIAAEDGIAIWEKVSFIKNPHKGVK